MKKILKTLVLLCLAIICSFGLIACGGDEDNNSSNAGGDNPSTPTTPSEPSTPALEQFTGITFGNKTVTYNGTEFEIVVEGTLPTDTTVAYTNNKGTNAGTYNASVTLSKEGYETKTLTATLNINKATYPSTILFESKIYVAIPGIERELLIEDETILPAGTEVVYANNKATSEGEYNATATLKNPNYVDKTLNATLTIKNLTDAAKNVMDTVMKRPDAWEYLPEAFTQDSLSFAATSMPIGDFTSNVSVSSINTKFVGAQMMVLYEGLLDAQSAIDKIDMVFAVAETITSAYQNFINSNPDNYANFEGSVAGFNVKILLTDTDNLILAGNATVSIELGFNTDTNVNYGRVQVTSGIELKYEMTDNSLTFAYKLGTDSAMKTSVVSFAREEDAVAGYIYSFLGVNGIGLKTTVVYSSDEEYTRVTSKKRESDDLIVDAFEEVYSSTTGEFLGGRVEETVKAIDFDTYWFNLKDVTNINSIRVSPEANLPNADTIYINGATDPIKTKTIGGIGLDMFSRRFDIEMRKVYYVQEVIEGEEVSYEMIEYSIPMLFVQTKSYEDFSDDFFEKNEEYLSAKPVITSGITTVVDEQYDALKALFDTIKSYTYETVVQYIGSANSFFTDEV